jgi:hypothetical protein
LEEECTVAGFLAGITMIAAMVWTIYYGGGDPVPNQNWYLTVFLLQAEVYAAFAALNLGLSIVYIVLRLLYMSMQALVAGCKLKLWATKVEIEGVVDVERTEHDDRAKDKEVDDNGVSTVEVV